MRRYLRLTGSWLIIINDGPLQGIWTRDFGADHCDHVVRPVVRPRHVDANQSSSSEYERDGWLSWAAL